MTDKLSSDSKKPMKIFSIKEFIKVFTAIDEQILQLHKCSSDDFLGLNADFKQYYRQSKVISDNASQIFQALTQKESNELLKDLENFYKDIKHVQNHFSKHLSGSIDLINEMEQLLDKLYLPVKNLNQDLLTLKFLLTNLKISNSTADSKKVIDFEAILNRFNEVINEFKICSFQNETKLEALKDLSKKTLRVFENILEKNIQELDIILNNIHFGIILFAEKHEEVARQIPELTQKTENSSKSIADIITNLQYHDIIRQKMEHVHATHKKLLEDLESTASTGEENLEKHERLLIRVRDIANLQSAQLVYANKEYQKAIEVITEKFIEIGNDMTTIASMCTGINASQINSDELYLQGLLEKLQNSANVLNKFLGSTETFSNSIDDITEQIGSTSKSVSNFSNSINKLKSITAETLEVFSFRMVQNEDASNSLKQIKNLYEEVEKFEGVIRQVYSKIENTGGKLLPDIGKDIKQAKEKGSFGQAAESMNSIISKLNQKNFEVNSLLDESLNSSKNVSIDVKESINKIKYYDFFEKIIVDIIGEFNHIYQMLRAQVNTESSVADDEVNAIKNLYTMASEHIIHDKVSQGDGDVDLFDEEVKNDEDDDNLELF